MRRMTYLLGAAISLTGIVVYMAGASGVPDEEAAPLFGIRIPPGYRDWKLISVAHEEGNNNDLRAVLGNDVASCRFRTAQLLPDWPGVTSLLSKTTKSLAVPNLSLPAPQSTFSLWSKTQ
jgi:hypothetical protein